MARAGLWLLALLAAALLGWWYFFPASLPVSVRHAVPVSPNAQSGSPALYKWRDDKGRLNVTDVPPTDRPYETVRYDPATNVVPGYRSPETTPPDPAQTPR